MNKKEVKECVETLKQAKKTLDEVDQSVTQRVIPYLRLGSPRKDSRLFKLIKNYEIRLSDLQTTIAEIEDMIKIGGSR